MSAKTMPMPVALPIPEVELEPFRFSREQYWRLADLDFFEDRRVELIGGEVVEMAPQSNFHSSAITLCAKALERAIGPGFWARTQATLDLSPLSQPDPDVSLVAGDERNPSPTIPTTALVVVEVAETSLRRDRGRKASLYAAAGIADYWIINLVDRVLEVRRNPWPDATQEFGHGYSSLTTLQLGDSVTPLAAPTAIILVGDMFPG